MSLFEDGQLLLDAQGQVLFCVGSISDILESPGTCVGQPLAQLSPDPALGELWQRALAGQAHQEAEVVTTALSKPKTLALSITPCPLGDASGWLVGVRDLSSLRRLESVERDFITNVSHELRTPLTSIKMAAESLQMGAIANPKLKDRFLSNIQREADRLTRLVNELLVLSNVQEAKTALHLSTFDTHEMLEDVMATMQPHAKVNDIELVSDFASAMPMMLADRDRLLQVLINLVDNAIKCTPPNGRVTLQARSADEIMDWRVVDTGIGIPSIDLPRIFDRFFRVDKSRSRVTGGTGLGLSIVKDIIEAHAGEITVESTVNVGTTFVMRLPVRAQNP